MLARNHGILFPRLAGFCGCVMVMYLLSMTELSEADVSEAGTKTESGIYSLRHRVINSCYAFPATTPAHPGMRQRGKRLPLHVSPIEFSDEIGCSPTFNYKYFDPLNLANEDNFARHREAELKHGRVAMLATLGMSLPELWFGGKGHARKAGIDVVDLFLTLVKGWRNRLDLELPGHPLSHHVHLSDIPFGLGALQVMPWTVYVGIFVVCGYVETQVLVQRSARDMPGDYGVGYFGLRDKASHERSLLVELEHGRLAMVAFLLQVLWEVLTGKTLGQRYWGGM